MSVDQHTSRTTNIPIKCLFSLDEATLSSEADLKANPPPPAAPQVKKQREAPRCVAKDARAGSDSEGYAPSDFGNSSNDDEAHGYAESVAREAGMFGEDDANTFSS